MAKFHIEYSCQNKITRKRFPKKVVRGEFNTQLIHYNYSWEEIIFRDIILRGGSFILNIPTKILFNVGNYD